MTADRSARAFSSGTPCSALTRPCPVRCERRTAHSQLRAVTEYGSPIGDASGPTFLPVDAATFDHTRRTGRTVAALRHVVGQGAAGDCQRCTVDGHRSADAAMPVSVGVVCAERDVAADFDSAELNIAADRQDRSTDRIPLRRLTARHSVVTSDSVSNREVSKDRRDILKNVKRPIRARSVNNC